MPLFGTRGERIGYDVHSRAEGAPPLVLLHGFTASRASFLSNIEGLSERFTVITVELLGHGASDAPHDAARYAPEPAVARIIGLLDELGHERVLLCGHSLGGALAVRLALHAPERIAGLIVLNSMSAAGTPEWRERSSENLRGMAERVRAEGTAFLRTTNLYPAHSKRLPDDARQALVDDFDRLQPAGVAGTAERLAGEVNAFERLPELVVPTLVIVGTRDSGFAEAAPLMVQQIRPDLAHTATIEDAGHAANLEQPRAFEDEVTRFAEGIGYLEPLVEPKGESKLRSLALTAVGAVLVAVGAGLLASAIIGGGDDSPTTGARAANIPTATSTVAPSATVDTIAGVRTPGTQPTASVPAVVPPDSPTALATTVVPTPTSPTVAPTATPAIVAPQATATPEPTATATAVPSATPVPATATPTGAFAAISGPTVVAAGGTATYVDVSPGTSGAFNHMWTYPGGSRSREPSVAVTFPTAPGCYIVSLTVIFASGPKSASVSVSVGGASCGGVG